MKFAVYLQMWKHMPERCFHTFTDLESAKSYAELGAIICHACTIIIDDTGKEVCSFEHRPS
jgi:hypothetical protein